MKQFLILFSFVFVCCLVWCKQRWTRPLLILCTRLQFGPGPGQTALAGTGGFFRGPPKKRTKKGQKKVLVLMSNTGGGHKASAEAIEAGFKQVYGDKCASGSLLSLTVLRMGIPNPACSFCRDRAFSVLPSAAGQAPLEPHAGSCLTSCEYQCCVNTRDRPLCAPEQTPSLQACRFKFDIVDAWKDHTPRPFNSLPGTYSFLVKQPILWRMAYMSQQPRIVHKPYLWGCGNIIGKHMDQLCAPAATALDAVAGIHGNKSTWTSCAPLRPRPLLLLTPLPASTDTKTADHPGALSFNWPSACIAAEPKRAAS